MPKSAGIIVNIFRSLLPKPIKAITDGLCVQDGLTPPSGSVVYLSFGSLGVFSSEQLKEIAKGLEMSGDRFLWVIRVPPPPTNNDESLLPPPEPDLDLLLPNGFLDRTKDRGFMVKKWAPQVKVLGHNHGRGGCNGVAESGSLSEATTAPLWWVAEKAERKGRLRT